jgi:hypothetical protein
MRNPRTPTNITVRKLDFSGTDEFATLSEWYTANHPDKKCPTEFRVAQTWGYVDLPDGSIWLICTEGVGYGCSDGVQIDIHGRWDDPAGDENAWRTSMFPIAELTFTVEEVRALPVTEEVNLEAFVRRFGARLENNYDHNRTHLETALGGAA